MHFLSAGLIRKSGTPGAERVADESADILLDNTSLLTRNLNLSAGFKFIQRDTDAS